MGACRDPPCIVTELAENGSLYDVIHKHPEDLESWQRVVGICLESARGMAYLHAQSPPILHRDLKSQNILLNKDYHAKVADFGISRPMVDDSMTMRVGTTRWTAPECLAKEGVYSEKADVYSFGESILQSFLTGSDCFVGNHREETSF